MQLDEEIPPRFQRARNDIWLAIRHPQIWLMLAIRNVRYSYGRTILGPWWSAIDQILFTFGFATLSTWLFGGEFETSLSYVGLGILSFGLLSQLITAGSQSLVTNSSLKHVQAPTAHQIFKTQFEVLLTFAHRLAAMLILLLILGKLSLYGLVVSTFSIALIAVWGVGTALFLAPLCTRFRDIQPMISLAIRLAFFASPVFWRADRGANSDALTQLSFWNPLAALMDIVRLPLLAETVSTTNIIYSLTTATCAVVLGMFCYSWSFDRIQYWS